MSAPTPCVPCCTTPQTVNIPGTPGTAGTAGAAGTNGINAYTVTTADFSCPAKGANVTVSVGASGWMVAGQPVFIATAGFFTVVSKPTTTSAILTYQNISDNTATGNNIVTGSGVSPAGEKGDAAAGTAPLSVYASGTAYSLTNATALLAFGTTVPRLTITAAGTWLIIGRVRLDYNAATFAGGETMTIKLRRTNNTAADLANSSTTMITNAQTTATLTFKICKLPTVVYTTLNANDIIEMWGLVSAGPSAGSMDAVEAEIVAIKIV